MSNYHGDNTKRRKKNDQLRVTYLAGICPQFWSHVPMMIQDVHNLQLIDGIHCLDLMGRKQPSPKTDSESSSSSSSNTVDESWTIYHRYAPISKCLLVGTIVYADIRRDGSMVYVLDDGTGLMDCVHWSTSDQHQDIYHLPDLMGNHQLWVKEVFAVGDTVRVFGKIECLARENIDKSGLEKRQTVVAEIQAALIEPVQGDTMAIEARHWQRRNTASPKSIQYWLDLLGPQIQAQIYDRVNLPAADDTLGQWRVFGPSCQCDVLYKESLLYCHCVATLEPFDPSLGFRDALLGHLLQLQAQQDKMLVFPYKSVKTNSKLRKLAVQHAANPGHEDEEIIVDQMFRNTFRTLRKDGIVYLCNCDTDEYLLITRDRVLEPFVRNQMEQERQGQQGAERMSQRRNYVDMEDAPQYISKTVHMERLRYIQRCCLEEDATARM
ncbi:hypothetical protein IV203_025256 [Nitzschia inconspicua]|uniref:CST complex subunit Stn1 N-terminal domain-containing protein n=1 Tax=Nitzschia inconspicua TaxID=303405 RepID=A0A9K3LHU6_9STRA|nr:hypothetical protein IV203_024738 [Nitzschia inconspicua]KAG7362372.1 hypothetical protein IV203_025256 [Nitzschia inconspicua]